MTHPLTQREKVENALYSMENWRLASPEYLIENILTALASGSGDHAELARLADMADWMVDGDPGANGSVLLSASVASEHASDLKALLAEIAALRVLADDAAEHSMRQTDKLLAEHDRSTEAERKLAEAVGLFKQIEEHHGIECIPDNEIQAAIRALLSKEAERG